jgi:proteasome lid subunit RPN8/RPN11
MGFFTRLVDRVTRALFPRITQYHILPSVLERMRGLAQQTHPKEMVAFLRGHHEGDTLVVTDLLFQPFENTTRSATIHLDPNLTGVVGTFHSHPTPNALPSAADRRLFARHPGIHLISGWPYTSVHVYTQRTRFIGIETIPSATTTSSQRGAREEHRG